MRRSSPVEGMTNFHALVEAGGEPPAMGPESYDMAQIVYTSGTESHPKGVQLTHDAILWQYVSCMVDASIAGDDVAVHALPLYHCAQLDVFLGPSIYAGGVNVLTAKPVPDNIFRLIERERATSFFAPPTVWISMLRSPAFDGADLSSLRKGYYGASIMPVKVMREMARRMPKVRLWNLYGQTEIAPLATMLGPEDQMRKPGSCGRPVLNVETRVVDEQMRDVKPGEVGEIVHRSPHLMTGYYKDEDKTAEAFRGGWFHSGDLATVDGATAGASQRPHRPHHRRTLRPRRQAHRRRLDRRVPKRGRRRALRRRSSGRHGRAQCRRARGPPHPSSASAFMWATSSRRPTAI